MEFGIQMRGTSNLSIAIESHLSIAFLCLGDMALESASIVQLEAAVHELRCTKKVRVSGLVCSLPSGTSASWPIGLVQKILLVYAL